MVAQAVYVASDVTSMPFLYGHLDGPHIISQGNGRRDLFEALDVYLKVPPLVSWPGTCWPRFRGIPAAAEGPRASRSPRGILSERAGRCTAPAGGRGLSPVRENLWLCLNGPSLCGAGETGRAEAEVQCV